MHAQNEEDEYKLRISLISIIYIQALPFSTAPDCSSVGEPFSDTGRESAPPVALK